MKLLNLNDITPSLRVRIISVGSLQPLEPLMAIIDINEPLLIYEMPEQLKPIPEEPLPP